MPTWANKKRLARRLKKRSTLRKPKARKR